MRTAKEIGKELRKLRGERSLREVAKDLDLSFAAVSMYENGKRRPRDDVKEKIANYYNTSVQDLFF